MPDRLLEVAEGELLRHLVGLARTADLEPALAEALRLLAEATAATTAYLEVSHHSSQFSAAHPALDSVGRGVIGHALAHGVLVHSASAQADPRFRGLDSVRRHGIEAVVCAPFELRSLAGAVHVQRCGTPGAFSDRQRDLVEMFASQLALLAVRLLPDASERLGTLREETRRFQERLVRATLARTNGNVALAARELRISRTFVYRLTALVPRQRKG